MKICLIGSAKFEKEFIEANRELTLRGHIVYSLAVLPSQGGSKTWYTPGEKIILDLVHFLKILNSEAVFLVGDGYFGFSTAREIMWADMNDKTIIKFTQCHNWDNASHCLKHGVAINSTMLIFTAKAKLEKGDT